MKRKRLFIVTNSLPVCITGATDQSSTYGTAGSLVVLLLWVYFSSFILYFGAEFPKAYAVKYGTENKAERIRGDNAYGTGGKRYG